MNYPLPSILNSAKIPTQEYTCIPEYGSHQILTREQGIFIFDDSARYFETSRGRGILTRKVLMTCAVILFGIMAVIIYKKYIDRRGRR